MMTNAEMVERIDIVANAQRHRLAEDPVKVFEYMAAERDALAYRDAGFQGEVPPAVLSWSQARGWTAQAAAQDILTEAAMLHVAINLIRDIRLKAKYAIAEEKDRTRAQEIFDKAIQDLKAIG